MNGIGSKYFLSMKNPRSKQIHARLEALNSATMIDYRRAYQEMKQAFFAAILLVESEQLEYEEAESAVKELETRVFILESRLRNLAFRLSLVTEPTCKFCGSTWGLSPEVDLRYSVTFKQTIRKGCFWSCGYCYAHVLHAAYSNLPQMKGN